MKRIALLTIATLLTATAALAQPAKSRVANNAAAQQKAATTNNNNNTATDRAALQFPTAATMPSDVVWKRDIYRQINLLREKNAPLYYPIEPAGRQVNLFTYLFRLVLTGRVPAYTYKLDGSESFEKDNQLVVRDMLENQSIYYEEKGGKLTVADSDVPSAEVTRFYIKESVYLDQRSGTFTTRVVALCPVLMRGDSEFTTELTPYPLFWINYDDVAQWLARLPMMGSSINNVTNMTAADYFAMNRYEGKIYKTNNLQGRVLANYCKDDSAMVREQKRIEKELADFENNIWHAPVDSAKMDSIERAKAQVAAKSSSKKTAKSSTSTSEKTDSRREKLGEKSREKAQSAPRVSVRRQRR